MKKEFVAVECVRPSLYSPPRVLVFSSMSKENDPEKKEKTLATLDEGDLKLLQTYVREDTWKGPPGTAPTYSAFSWSF